MGAEYQIIYSKRKTVSLIVKSGGFVVVRAPRWAAKKDIEQWVLSKWGWVEKQKTKAEAIKPINKRFQEGERFLFLGKEHPLKITDNYRSRLYFTDSFTVSAYHLHKAKRLFEDWYKQKAKEILPERTRNYAVVMGLTFNKISIRSGTTRWGSCSSRGNINYSWRLVMAPLEIIDYVVVHELAHLVHKNHSNNFWKYVENFYPGFRQARLWLRKNGHFLQL